MPTVDIDREAAREAAERELAKPIYPRPSPKQQFIDFLETLVQRLILRGAELPGGWFTISVLLILLAAAVVAAVTVGRRMLRDGRGDQRLFGTTQRSAAEYRATAQHCAAAGDWGEAIRHGLRAVARELEETGVLHAAPGRTATELARDAGAALPALADALLRAAETFNDVSYGELPATPDGYRIVADIDEQVCALTQRRLYR
ncbi:MAG: DUF4129 domain-containing protein [Mycolicibacter algericus]|uniref:Protein-glutamine gamma-glutamyltransferase-like C-terminal domain-containing protein n=2 Tax=Mycobacteriaceae TaxID=1762 RepID=F5YSY0_MYCSD|nr:MULTISPECIES: DUF4129 domain-containing protein [Mycobacteriaceae]AEF37969.1 conserved hypothetical protein [Mycolicibacter sinensis]BBX13149.1 membrane protein [Mycobacterium novum]